MIVRRFVLAFALCAADSAAAAQSERLDVLRIEGKTITTAVARANGFFAKHGIEVQVSSSPSSEVMRAKLSSGAVDIVDDGLDNAVKMNLDGTDVVILTGSRLAQQELIGQSEIKSTADVRGRSVIVDAPDTQAALLLKKILELAGLRAGVDYQLVPVGMSRYAAMQANRSYSAAMMSGPEAVIAKRMGFNSLGLSSERIGPILYHGSYARRQWAVAHKDLVERYVAANIEAQRWLLAPTNKTRVTEMLRDSGPDKLSASEADKVYQQLIDGPEALTKDLGFDVAAFKNFLQVRADVEKSWQGAVPSPAIFFDDSYLRGAAARLSAQQAPYGSATVPANASCQALIDSGYVPPKFPEDGKPRIDQANLLVQNCYPPYGNQIPNVSNTLPESGSMAVLPQMPRPKAWHEESAWNLEAVGYHDNQSRPVYQPLVFNYQNHTGSPVWRNREILFNGNAGGTARNCEIPGCPVQHNGTSIIDVTVPARARMLFHIPSGPTPSDPTEPIGDGAQMVRVCSGNQLNKDSSALSESANKGLGIAWKGNPAIANKVYLLRQNGKGTGSKTRNTAKQEIWDVTDPTAPSFVADLLVDNYMYRGGGGPQGFVAAPLPPILDHAHKNWWECDTGMAYIVGGKETDNFGTMQHIYVYNLRDPTHPVFIRQYALAGGQRPAHKNTGSCTNAPSDTCYQGTTNPPGGLHGAISMGNLVNRVYSAWGIMRDGIVQIAARDKLINGCFTTAASAWEQTGTATGFNPSASPTCAAKPGSGINPSQSDSLFPQISVITMQRTQGGHSTMPVLGVPLPTGQGAYLDKGYPVGLDLFFVASEATASNCSGQSAHEAWIESIGVFQLPGAFPSAAGGFANVIGADDALRKSYSSTDEEQWPVATLGVAQQPGAFCAKGSRFGAHAITEAIFPAYYGRIQCVSWFNGGERCWDIRNPKHPVPIAYWISKPGPAKTPIGNLGATAASDGIYYSAPGGTEGEQVTRAASVANHGEFDDRGFLYVVDRAGTGTAILQFNGGAAAQVINAKPVQPKPCSGAACASSK